MDDINSVPQIEVNVMSISGVFNHAILGMQRGLAGLNRDSARLASAKAMTEGPSAAPLVDSKINALQVEANAKVVTTTDKAIGSLFNEKA